MPIIDVISLYLVLGAFVGFMSGLLGVGGGFLSVVYMVYKNMDLRKPSVRHLPSAFLSPSPEPRVT